MPLKKELVIVSIGMGDNPQPQDVGHIIMSSMLDESTQSEFLLRVGEAVNRAGGRIENVRCFRLTEIDVTIFPFRDKQVEPVGAKNG